MAGVALPTVGVVRGGSRSHRAHSRSPSISWGAAGWAMCAFSWTLCPAPLPAPPPGRHGSASTLLSPKCLCMLVSPVLNTLGHGAGLTGRGSGGVPTRAHFPAEAEGEGVLG